MYLIDTNVVSEARKGKSANQGVLAFFKDAATHSTEIYLSVITIGELRRGVEVIRHRGDLPQSDKLEAWLVKLLTTYAAWILPLDQDIAQLWGRLRVPHHESAIDKQIAATALIHDLTLVTRNRQDFAGMGVRLINPFSAA
ncbi:type II toxin-antitoxin system VapC family toxin [Aquabacterium sp.]|uniref:type II toxin-antitoxin system VapC family toxin n=1 Tax=Aquabacterium sp. TaxID=1872578 RepID=UPI002BC7ED78|nr:type II toxin-antitoxin system VapC family toxin [Aquabacterium sp.]HSW05626.1 type II toxin-antitoxin system VapC family toxin [Aquabacterium sp.]